MINSGDTAWLLMSSALVFLMTTGIAFFYSGLVSSRNVINTINMCFVCCAVVPIVWAIAGFSLAFSEGNRFIGGFEWLNLRGMVQQTTGSVPQYAFVQFQMAFAVIAPALIAGAVVGRMKFKPYVLFVALWSLLIYSPVAHWVWGPGGWIATLGAIDFAGGTVVHINAGFAALTAAVILGPRLSKKARKKEAPHNIPFVILGASLLWFGWYGFNAGSALTAGQLASLAFLTTTLAAAASMLTWSMLGWIRGAPSTGVGKATAAVIGLVAITPAAGYVTPMGSMVIGLVAAAVCQMFLVYRECIFKHIDDTLDVFICHGIGGVIGSLMAGLLATRAVNSTGVDGLLYGNPGLLWKQVVAVAAVAFMSVAGTAAILFILKMLMNVRPTAEEEHMGIDAAEHGEAAYDDKTPG
ncbi:ammonium transporter [Legionella sp. CNM-4043-24]|uniref:ammonium transporter n=1 Tax=Legionella sp. CNM-4043-24 TaxID=3421646 RepID=UPI00403AEC04